MIAYRIKLKYKLNNLKMIFNKIHYLNFLYKTIQNFRYKIKSNSIIQTKIIILIGIIFIILFVKEIFLIYILKSFIYSFIEN